jgi:hypothetical protein
VHCTIVSGSAETILFGDIEGRLRRSADTWRNTMATQSNRLPQLGGISIERALAFQTSASKAVQAVAAEAADHAKVSFEQGVAVLEQLVAAKSLDKAIEVQTAHTKSAYAALIARSKKIGELYAGFAKDALKPIAA